MKKRILPALLALCMVISLLPVTVFAGDEEVLKCTCEGTSACTHKKGECEKTDGLVKGEQTLCDTCKANKEADDAEAAKYCDKCGCAYASCSDCTPAGKDAEGKGGEAVCKCKAGTADEGYTCGSSGCHFKKCDNELCKVYGSVIDVSENAHEHEVATSCKDAANPKALQKCTETEKHKADCPFACGVLGCTKTKGHVEADKTGKEKHEGEVCTGDAGCPAKDEEDPTKDIAAHTSSCPIYKAAMEEINEAAADPESGVNVASGSESYTFYVDCKCTGEYHDKDGVHGGDEKGDCANAKAKAEDEVGAAITVTIKYDYVWMTEYLKKDDKVTDKVDTKATAENEKEAKEDAIKAAQKLAEDKWKAENNDGADALCTACATATGVDICTKAATCPATGGHREDCLALCTYNDKCPNTEGDSTAHVVRYQVAVDGELKGEFDTRAKAEELYRTELQKINAAIKTAESELKKVQEKADATEKELKDANKAVTDAKKVTITLLAIHCPKAKVPTGTVVATGAGDEIAETPAETPEKPTKAEDFTDMEDWMAEGVQFMLDKGWMEGLGDGKFGGRDDLKTTMVLTVLARMNGETITGSTWAEDATAWAEKNAEFFEGIDLTSDNMARKDVVLVLWRQAGKPEPSADFELEFTDVEGLEGDHLTAMKWAVENKIVLGNGDGTVSPDGNINRSALSLLTMRADKAASK